jgi:hypothetical protein
VQTAAKQKFADDKPTGLKDYYVGANITQSRSQLEQATGALTAAAQAYRDADSTQAGRQTLTSGGRVSLEDRVDQINKGRRKILFAVEAAWPSDNAANAPIRREFGLPPGRPFVG